MECFGDHPLKKDMMGYVENMCKILFENIQNQNYSKLLYFLHYKPHLKACFIEIPFSSALVEA